MDLYDIWVCGKKVYASITEAEMEEYSQDLADEYYANGYPHPDDVEICYLGHEGVWKDLLFCASK